MLDSNYVVQESVVARVNQDGTVILMKMDEGNTFFKINGVAAEVWSDISEKKDTNHIIRTIAEAYEASESKIRSDVTNLIETLLDKNLIKRA